MHTTPPPPADVPAPPPQVNSSPLPVPTAALQSFKDKTALEASNQAFRDHIGESFAAYYEEKNKNNPNVIKAGAWKRVDKDGNPPHDATVTSKHDVYTLREPGFYKNDKDVLIEVDAKQNIQIIGPEKLKGNSKGCLEVLFDAIALNRGEPTVEIKMDKDDEDTFRRLQRILRMDYRLAAKFRKQTEEMIAVAGEKGLAIHFDENYRKLMTIAGNNSLTGKVTEKIMINGKETTVPWSLAMQQKENHLQQKQFKTGQFWEQSFLKDRKTFADHLLYQYSNQITGLISELQSDSITATAIAANTETILPGTTTNTKMADHFMERVELLAGLHESMLEQIDPSRLIPEPKHDQHIAFIENIAKISADQMKRLQDDQKMINLFKKGGGLDQEKKTLQDSIATVTGTADEQAAKKKEIDAKIERITKAQKAFAELAPKQEELKNKANEEVKKIKDKKEAGVTQRTGPAPGAGG